MELPIPRHLKEYIILCGSDNDENQVTGTIHCSCNGETFFVYSSNEGGIVKLVCTQCKKEILLFDAGKHGWNGFVCKDDFLDHTEPFEEHFCPDCDSNSFVVSVCISSQGQEDFMEECVENDDSFTIEDWVDGFEWIQITLSCTMCNSREEEWVDYETM